VYDVFENVYELFFLFMMFWNMFMNCSFVYNVFENVYELFFLFIVIIFPMMFLKMFMNFCFVYDVIINKSTIHKHCLKQHRKNNHCKQKKQNKQRS